MRKFVLLLLVLLIGMLSTIIVMAQDDVGQMILDAHTECEVDLTGETITIYHFGDLSGVYAFITQPLLAAVEDGIAFYNANGGVCGAMLATTFEDTAGDLEATQAAYDRFTGEYDDMKLVLLYASGDSELLREQLAEDEIVSLISAGSVEGLYGEDGATPGWIYASNPLYVDQIGAFCDYIGANSEQYPDPVIGYISWPGAFGEAAFTSQSIAYCAEAGVGFVEEPQIFLPTDTDIVNQVLNLTDAGANILYTNTLASGPVLVTETVRALGLEGEVTIAGVNWVLDTSVGILSGQRAGDGMPATNGMLGSMPFLWWTEITEPAVQFVRAQAEMNERSLAAQNIAYILTWGSVNQIAELYIRAVNATGSLDAVTGNDLKNVLDNETYSVLLGLVEMDFRDGNRDAATNRIAMLGFMNATGDGMAMGRDDAMIVPTDSGDLFIPIVVPLTDFAETPDLRTDSME